MKNRFSQYANKVNTLLDKLESQASQTAQTLASQTGLTPEQRARQFISHQQRLMEQTQTALADPYVQQAFAKLLPSQTVADYQARSAAKGLTDRALWQDVLTTAQAYTQIETGNNALGCFVAGTRVLTESGLKPIQDIKAGDKVLSKPENGQGEPSYKPVLNTMVFHNKPIWLLEAQKVFEVWDYEGNKIDLETNRKAWIHFNCLVTGNHPVWVVGTSRHKYTGVDFYDEPCWKNVDELQPEEIITNADGVMYGVERAQPVYQFAGDNVLSKDTYYWYEVPEEEDVIEEWEEDYKEYVWRKELEEARETVIEGRCEDINDYYEDGTNGMYVEDKEGDIALVNTLKNESGEYIPFTDTVYNLEVADNHTYFLDRANIWVHNTSSPAQKLLQTAREMAESGPSVNQVDAVLEKLESQAS